MESKTSKLIQQRGGGQWPVAGIERKLGDDSQKLKFQLHQLNEVQRSNALPEEDN